MVWVLEHRRDLEADFRVFYRLTPAEALELDFPEWLALAHRVSAYEGVMRLRAEAQEREEQRTRRKPGTRMVEGTRDAVQSDPLLAEAISFN